MVKHPDEMSDDIFIAHVNTRHTPLAGMRDVTAYHNVTLLRRYHLFTHRFGREDDREVNHEHRGIERTA